jgi:hypothetical protein
VARSGRQERGDHQDKQQRGEETCATRHRSIHAPGRAQRRFSAPHFGADLPPARRGPHHGRVVNFCAKVHRVSVTREVRILG